MCLFPQHGWCIIGAQKILTAPARHVGWGGEGEGTDKKELNVVIACKEVVLILADRFGNKINSFRQQAFIEHLRCAWHYLGPGDIALNKIRKNSCPCRSHISAGETEINK